MNSRYNAVPTTSLETSDGTTIVYLSRRFVPGPERFVAVGQHVVIAGDRLDTITARHVGDPELFWQVCDANRAMRPEELEAIGRVLRITLPEGIPGVPSA
jgi:hypothetical protein